MDTLPEHLTTENPESYTDGLAAHPQLRFKIGDRVKVASKGRASDPGYEHIYRSGDPGKVEAISRDGWHCRVRFGDKSFCDYLATDLRRNR